MKRAGKPTPNETRKPRAVPSRVAAPATAPRDTNLLSELLDDVDRADVMLGFLFHDLARTRKRANHQFMKAYGLTRTQWHVLARLSRRDGMTQTALADELDIGKANLGGVIEELEAAGWVERHELPSDMRAKRVFLTRSAVGLMRRMFQSEVEFNNQTLGDLSRKERDQLFRLLSKVKDRVSAGQAATEADD